MLVSLSRCQTASASESTGSDSESVSISESPAAARASLSLIARRKNATHSRHLSVIFGVHVLQSI